MKQYTEISAKNCLLEPREWDWKMIFSILVQQTSRFVVRLKRGTHFKLRVRPHEADWPTIVIQAGWSESLRKLRPDAGFWLEFWRGRKDCSAFLNWSKQE